MMNHLVVRTAVSLLFISSLFGCGGSGGGSTVPEDSGPPMTAGELSNAGDSTLTDGDSDGEVAGTQDPNVEQPVNQPADDATMGTAGSIAQIAGLWDDSFTYPDGRVNITYLEITADGRYVNHDYRGDSFDMGENCYENVEGVISVEADGSFLAVILGEELRFDAIAIDGQLQVSFSEGGTTSLSEVIGLSVTDFNEC